MPYAIQLLLQGVAPAQSSGPVTTPVLSWGQTIMLSLTGALGALVRAIPRVIGFVIVLFIGWFVASLVAKAIGAVLRAIRFDEIAAKTGVADFVSKMGTDANASGVAAGVVKWLLRLVFVLVAFDILGLPAVSDVLRQLLLWIPNLIVAIVILLVAGVAARALGNVVRGATAEAGFTNPDTLANVSRTAVWVFAIIVAVNQVGIAATLINTLVTGAVGMLALGGGLAFGLGGRELAGSVLENWYGQAHAAKPKAQRAVESAKRHD